MSLVIEIADAVARALNEGDFDPPVTAVRRLVPQWTLRELQTLRVTVVPGEVRDALADRGRASRETDVEIGIEKKVSGEAEAEPLVALLEAMADHLRQRRLSLPDGAAALWLRNQVSPAFAPEHLDELRLYTGVLVVTYRTVG